ncbi:MAG: NAD(P)-dependent oxidoreductase [Anaerolinea sp.]|nr:NAD(P)-dependent oxidoreductase [Anaerolinea sp.]
MEKKEQRTALITGASAGLGAEYARQLAGLGYNLVLVSRRRERLEQLAQEIKTANPVVVEVLPADLSTDAGITLVEERIKEMDDLEMLVNNAGFGLPGGFLASEIQVTLTMVWVHVLAPVRLTRAALPGMIENGRGYIINVSSISAFAAATGSSTYSATKAYLNNFTEGLAVECHGKGVKLQALCPGFTITEFQDSPGYQRLRVKERLPRFLWMTSRQVVKRSLRELRGNRVIYVPGVGNKLIALVGRLGLVGVIVRVYTGITGRRFTDID